MGEQLNPGRNQRSCQQGAAMGCTGDARLEGDPERITVSSQPVDSPVTEREGNRDPGLQVFPLRVIFRQPVLSSQNRTDRLREALHRIVQVLDVSELECADGNRLRKYQRPDVCRILHHRHPIRCGLERIAPGSVRPQTTTAPGVATWTASHAPSAMRSAATAGSTSSTLTSGICC